MIKKKAIIISIAGTILTTECVLTNIKDDNKAVVGPGQMPMM